LEGVLNWIKLPMPASRYYPSGFTNYANTVGARYSYSGTLKPVLDFTNGMIGFSFGNLIGPFTNNISLDANGRVANLGSNSLVMNIKLSTGEFTGSSVDKNAVRPVVFRGAVLQKQSGGFGYFLGTNHSGRVVLAPAP
jgi:hypothetical protein